MRLKLLLPLMLCWMGSILLAVDETMVDYQRGGGLSSYSHLQVKIGKKGEVMAAWEKYDFPKASYETRLSEEELAYVRTLIQASDFFEAPENDDTMMTDVGESVLRVSLAGQERTIKFGHRASMEPLTQLLWKLVTQGQLLQEMAEQKDIYLVLGGLSDSQASAKVLQPRVFIEPLQDFIGISKDRQKTEWAMEALAAITTPEAFAGCVSRTADKDAERRKLILSIIGTYPFSGNIPKKHLESLGPYCLAFVKENIGRRSQLSSEEQNTITNFIQSFGYSRYAPAIPWLVQQIASGDAAYVSGFMSSLCSMGDGGVGATQKLLDHREERVRLSGIEVLVWASRSGPKCGYANPVSDWEYKQMKGSFERWVLPELNRMTAGDTSGKVQEKAKAAIIEIKMHVQKESAAGN